MNTTTTDLCRALEKLLDFCECVKTQALDETGDPGDAIAEVKTYFAGGYWDMVKTDAHAALSRTDR